ncbi:MAG: hypothetical protein H6551_12860 [Chitinophagales bacterium]|nr:hypothetical protein [Chitinophagaceae bacterium]MCB9066022.1 hypothetical protein [Chitinophagales bacterium]
MVATLYDVAIVFYGFQPTGASYLKTRHMRYLLLITTIFLTGSVYAQKMTEDERACVRQQNLAQKDYYNKEMKYYSFGLMPTNITEKGQAETIILKQYYNIEHVSMGCIVDNTLLCYNKQVDRLMKRKYGNNFWSRVSKQADSLMKTTPPR